MGRPLNFNRCRGRAATEWAVQGIRLHPRRSINVTRTRGRSEGPIIHRPISAWSEAEHPERARGPRCRAILWSRRPRSRLDTRREPGARGCMMGKCVLRILYGVLKYLLSTYVMWAALGVGTSGTRMNDPTCRQNFGI